MIEAEQNRKLMTGNPLRRDLALSEALGSGKLAARAIWAGNTGPIEAMLEATGRNHERT